MDLKSYQAEALKTAGGHTDFHRALTNWSLGLIGEAGEFADEVKKVVFHGKALQRNRLVEELGDTLWYLAVASHELGATLDEVAEANIAKLRHRHGGSGFVPHQKQNRSTHDELLRSPKE